MKPLIDDLRRTRELLLNQAQHRADVQRSAIERVEAKAAIVLGVSVTAAQFIASRSYRSGFLPLAMGAYVVAIGCSLVVAALRNHHEVDPAKFVNTLWQAPYDYAVTELVAHYNRNFKINRKRARWRQWVWWGSAGALAIGAIMSVLHVTQGDVVKP